MQKGIYANQLDVGRTVSAWHFSQYNYFSYKTINHSFLGDQQSCTKNHKKYYRYVVWVIQFCYWVSCLKKHICAQGELSVAVNVVVHACLTVGE